MHTFSCYIFRDKGLYVYTQFCVLIKEIHGHTHIYLYTLTALYKYATYYKYKCVGHNCSSSLVGNNHC